MDKQASTAAINLKEPTTTQLSTTAQANVNTLSITMGRC
jgi:hypothetical protein